MSKQITVNLYILCVSILLYSCAINRTIPTKSLDSSIVPIDFNPQKYVLLVVEMPERRNPAHRNNKLTIKMENLLKEYYPYKFEIASPEEISSNDSRFADTSIYKYAMLNNLNSLRRTTYTTVSTSGGGQHIMSPSAITTYLSFNFFDRVNKKNYGSSAQSAWLKTSIQAFANTIKKARKLQ